MWPFTRRNVKKPSKFMRRLVAGLIIGGAIGSIVGSHAIDKAKKEHRELKGDDEE